MPKLKTSKSAVKRVVKITKTGAVIVRETRGQHLARRKSRRRLQGAGYTMTLKKGDAKRVRRLVPHM